MRPRWPWWAPVFSAFVVIFFSFLLVKAVAAALAIALILAVGRRPERALAALLIGVPFQAEIFAFVYRIGVPGEFVRQMSQWKEILIVGVLVAGARKAVRERHRLDRLDLACLAYVGLGTAYFLLPTLFVGSDGVGSSLPFNTRLLGWRTDVLYLALFLACRHIRLSQEAVARLVRVFVATATVVAFFAFFEFVFPSTWNNLLIQHLRLHEYKLFVLNVRPADDPYLFDVRVYTSVGGRQVLRVGSTVIYYWALGFYMVIADAALADRVVRGAARPIHYVILAMTAGSVLLTQTRSAVLALVVVLAITLLRRSGRTPRGADARARFAIVLGALAMFAIPAALAMGLVDRFQGGDDFSSNDAHRDSFDNGFEVLLENPVGRGLATAAGAGQAADVAGRAITETQFLQIGTQLGLLGLALWLGVAIGAIISLGQAAARAPNGFDTGLATGMRTALMGLFVGCFFLQPYVEYAVCWSVWPLAGLALGTLESVRPDSTTEPLARVVGPAPSAVIAFCQTPSPW